MEIRLATVRDVDALFLLNALDGQVTTKEFMREMLLTNQQEFVCIALDNGFAVGYCTGLLIKSMCHHVHRGEVESIYVREEYRNRGVGKALLDLLEKQFTDIGVNHFHLTTKKVNFAAQALYEKMGYVDAEEIFYEKTIVENCPF